MPLTAPAVMPANGTAQARPPSELGQALRLLDGQDRLTLQRLLYSAWRRPDTVTKAQRAALAQALIHLRRTGNDRYLVRAHRERTTAETRLLSRALVRQVLSAALTPRSEVRILGELHTGTIVHLVVGQDPYDSCPAPWYIVGIDSLHICRAHGAEELESPVRRA